jgi:hypothetical protein
MPHRESKSVHLVDLEFVVYVSGILLVCVTGGLHVVCRSGVVLLDAAFAVTAKSIAAEIGVVGI